MKLFILVCLVVISGCAKNSLYFGSYTRVGIDASTAGAGIGVKNAALNISPPKDDETLYDVLGTTDMDLGYTYAVIDEKVAIGDAAKCAAQKAPSIRLADLKESNKTKGAVVFGAYTSWALLDLSWGDSTSQGIHLGYKRGVGVRVPVNGESVGSVYAHIIINTTDQPGFVGKVSDHGGIRYSQTFATGVAAIQKASAEAQQINGGNNEYKGCILE